MGLRTHPSDTFLMSRYTRAANVYHADLPDEMDELWKNWFRMNTAPMVYDTDADMDERMRSAMLDVMRGLWRFLHHKPTVHKCLDEFASL